MTNMANSASNSRRDTEKAVKDIKRDLDRRIDAITTELKEKGPEGIEAAERSLGDLKAGFEQRLTDMRETIDDAHERFDGAVETGRTTIQERPLMAVGIALAAGVAIGLIFGRRNKN
jgi:ElaB/YqjD/DUF883 family membrane-anchored ribosome-binding protein